MKLLNKVIAITGGSSGIGFGITKCFLKEGAKVAIFARNLENLKKANAECNNQLLIYQGDIKKVKDLEDFYTQIKIELGNIDVVVANAGSGLKGFVSETTEEQFDDIVNTNFKGTFFTIQKALPHMNDGGSMIMISSMAGNLGISGNGLYGATKAAINHLTTTLTAELLQTRKIRVNTISPGYTMTPAFERLIATDDSALEKRKKNIPLGRLATTDDIANIALFLASEDSGYICGVNLIADGGVSCVYPNSSYKPLIENKLDNTTIKTINSNNFFQASTPEVKNSISKVAKASQIEIETDKATSLTAKNGVVSIQNKL